MRTSFLILSVILTAWSLDAAETPSAAPPAPSAAPAPPPAASKPAEAAAAAKTAEAKPAEAKPADAKAPVPKPAEAKPPEAKPAESKPQAPQPPEAKTPEPKPAEAKPAEAKPPEAKPAEAKTQAPKPPEAKALEAKPAEPKPAEAKPTETAKPQPSYTLLARPAIADRLKLSEEQRTKVAALLAERREGLAKATAEAERAKVLEANETKLAALLSDAQRADFAQIPPEPLLRFKFRFQRWVDVLEEVARQAGLSLVLDAPPPGTLNYSDDKEYTPTEAIDLLNSVLLTKGFTLIRRDRMLVCVNTEEGIPENLVPQVTLDELDYRGKFELVRVAFPLEKRPASTVAEEIKPLMSPLGKVVPLPSTGQLLITDAAGNMRAIRALIQAMPATAAAAAPAAPTAKPEPLVFAMYPLKGVDPPSVLSVMKTLYPSNSFVLDPKTDQLSVHAGASVQASVKAIIEEMMKTGQPQEKQSRLELYPIDPSRGAEMLKNLEGIVPSAKLTFDTKTGKLVAWATGADHDLLKKSLQTLGMAAIPEQARQFEVYRLTKADPKSTLAMLEALLPTARLAVDAPTNSLVAIASAADQKAIKSLLEQLQPEKPGPETPELRFYQLTRTPTAGMATVIEGLTPKAKVTIDPTNKRLMVVAPAAEHAAVKATVEQFEKGSPPEEKNKLVNYPVTQAQRKRFQAVMTTLTTELPGIQVITDAEPGELAIWAKPEQHKVIAEILEQLKREVPAAEKYVLTSYPLTVADPTSVTTVLKTMFPTLQVTLDPKTNRLLVWALPSEHESLKKAIEQLQTQVPADKLPRFEAYPLHGSEPTALTANLQTLVPNAKITTDTKAGRLVVWATAAEHEAIRGALEKLGRGTSIENTPQVETYRLARVDPTTLVPLLQSLVPEAKVSVDTATKTLIVVAIPADQQTIRGVLRQFQPEKSGYDAPELRIYPITTADPTSVTTALKSAFPALQITHDAKTNRLLVSAFPTEHDAVKKTLEQIQSQIPASQLPRFESYPLHGADPTSLVTNLQTLAPNAKLIPDAKTGKLFVWGTPPEQEIVRGAIEKLLGRGTGIENTPQVETYRLSRVDPTTIVPLLQSIVPEAKVSVDAATKTVVVLGVPADQQTVRGVLQQFQPEKGGQAVQERFEVYQVHGADPTTLTTHLQTLVPNAKLVADAKGGRIVAWGTGADHDALKSALEKMVRGTTPESAPRLEVYRLTKADPTTLTPLLQTLVPDAKISVDSQTKTLIAVAAPADHLTIKTVLEQLQPEKPAPDAPQLRFYPLAQPLPATIVTVLQGLAPKAQVTLEPGGKRLTVVASPADHAIVKAAIEQIQTVSVLDEKSKLVTYPVTPGQKKRFQSVTTALASELPGMQIVPESEPDQLAVWAKPSQHAVISEILEQLKLEVPAAEKYQLVAYSIKAADPQNVLTVMKTLFPNVQFVLDARTRRLIVWTLPGDQEAIKAALEKIDTGTAVEGQDKLMVYPVPDIDPATAIKALEEQLPNVKFSTDSKSGAILAWARPAEHQIIARTLKQLKVEPDAEHKETLVVYPLASGDATALSTVLKTLVPKAQVAVDAKTNNLMATAVPKDHDLIRAAIDQVAKQGPAGTRPEMVVHNLPSLGPSGAASLIPTLKQIFPDATFAAGADATKLVVWARPADQEPIRKAIEEMAKKEPADIAHKLVIYTVDRSGPASGRGILTILRSLFPDASIGYGSDPNRLFVWARPAEHPSIKNTIDELTKKEPAENAHRLVVFTLDKQGPSGVSGVMSVLQTMFPQVLLTAGSEPDQLVAWVQPSQEKEIREALKTLAMPEDPKKARQMVVYTMEATGASGVTGAITVLTTMFPEAKFNAGTEPHKLVVWARPAEHEKIKVAIDELAKKEPPEKAHRMVIYTLESAGPGGVTGAISVLTTMFPEVKLTPGSAPHTLVAWARPSEHEKIKAALDEMAKKEPARTAPRMVVYTLESTGPGGVTSAMSVLSLLFPEAKFNAGTEPNKLVAWARPAEHKKIKAAIDELAKKEPPEKARKIVVYKIRAANASASTYTMSLLKTMFSDAQFTIGTENDQLVVWARPNEHADIKSTIDQISSEEPGKAHQMVVYTIEASGTAGVTGAMSVLTTMFPDAKFAAGTEPDKVVAWARPDDQKKIAAAVAELSKKEPPEKAQRLVIYTLETTGPAGMTGAISILTSMFPDAKFTPGSEPDKVAVWARPADHKRIEAAVKEISSKEPPEKAHQMVVYALETTGAAGATGAMTILTTMFPEAKFAAGTEPNKIVAWARPDDQKKIAAAVAELSKKEPAETARKVVVYPFKSADANASYYTLAALRSMFADAQFSVGADPHKLAVWARPSDHEAIKSAIEQLSQEDPPDKAHKLVIYTLETTGSAGMTGAISILTSMFPDAKLTPGSEPDKVAVWARPADLKRIEAAIKELSSKEPPEKARQMVVYSLETTGTAGATGAMTILTTMFPEAKFAAGTEPNKVVAWARPEDQKKIAAAVAELSKKEPAETARKMVVYPFKSADSSSSYYTLAALRTMFPDAQFSIGADHEKLAVWARPTDHAGIKSAVEQLSQEDAPEKARRMAVYTLEGTGTAGVTGPISILTAMFPDATFSQGTEPDQVVAWARPADQDRIKAAVAELGKKAPPEKARKIVVYPFKSARPRAAYYTIMVLREMFPDAMFSIGAEPDKVVVWARPAEHEAIKTTVEQLSKEDPPERAFKLATYTMESAGAAGTSGAITMLTSMFPEAHFSAGSDPGKVVAWARPDDHTKIKAAIEELGKKEPPEKAAQAAVYQLNSMMATPAITFLTTAFPEAQFSAGAEPHTLIVWARPADQKQIKTTIEKLDVEGAEKLLRAVAVYALKAGDASSLSQLLEPMTRRNVQFVTDPVRHRLIVWADAKQQEQVRATVEQFQKENAKIGEPSTQVYRFERAEPQAAQTVLTALVPAAQIALDATTHSLVVTATPDDHAKIKAAIDEMDRRDEKGQAPRLQVHRLTTADPANLLDVLQGLFRSRSDVQLSLDEQNDAIVAVASPAQHETIQNLIDQLEKEAKADSAARLQLYPLKDADARATLRVLNELFEKQGAKVRLSLEPRSNQIVAIARPEQHATIQKTLDQIKGEERVLEIFSLEVVDPWTAEMAIGKLFTDGDGYSGDYGPSIDVDPTSQQLFVRATKEQLTKIRELLVKLGETGLGTISGADGRRSRTVSFDGDLSTALDEIQRVWPQLRSNPIHVMKPANEIPVQGRSPKQQKKKEDIRIRPAAGPTPPMAAVPRNEVAVPAKDAGWRPASGGGEATSLEKPNPKKPSVDTSGWRASKSKSPQGQEKLPVVVIPGEGSVTITSDDPAAVAQFEELLRSLSRQRGTVGRNFSVYLLENAKASSVAQTLQHVFRRVPTGWRSTAGSVVFVPDDRLNAIVAYATRADRATIESLIKVLDTSDVPESLAADRMHLIPVKNTSAARIEQILRDMFKNQVEALSVEATTNSLVVMASDPLVEEITRVVNTLDEAAGSDPSRNVTIVPLKKASSERVQKALDVILKNGTAGKRR